MEIFFYSTEQWASPLAPATGLFCYDSAWEDMPISITVGIYQRKKG